MDPLGLKSAAGEHQLTVEVAALEHRLKGLGELGHVVKMFIVLKTNPVFSVKVTDEIVLHDVHLQELPQEIKMGGLEVRQKILGRVLGILGSLCLSRLLLLRLGLGFRVRSVQKAVFLGDFLGLPQGTIFVRLSAGTFLAGFSLRSADVH